MANVSEYRTRRDKIDKLLEKSGWNIKDRTKPFEEVDTKQSDFTSGKYKTVSQTGQVCGVCFNQPVMIF